MRRQAIVTHDLAHEEPENIAVRELMAASLQRFEAELWKEIEVSPNVGAALLLLGESNMRLSALALKLGITKAAVTKLADALERDHLAILEKDPKDARVSIAAATSKGRDVARRIRQADQRLETKLEEATSAETVRSFKDLMVEIALALDGS